jgi:hypothetical protein
MMGDNFPGQRPLLDQITKHLRAITDAPIPVSVDYAATADYQTAGMPEPVQAKLYRVLFGYVIGVDGPMTAAQPIERFVMPTFDIDGVTFKAHWQKTLVLETNTADAFEHWCAFVVNAFAERNKDALAAWAEKYKETM